MEDYFLVYLSFTFWLIGLFILLSKQSLLFTYLSIFIAAFLIRYCVASQDHFLHSWDERYHALVGKNLVNTLSIPTLRDKPVLPYNSLNWQESHVWVHKQPVFLYQIAASVAVLGNTEMAVRFPSIIMGALLALIIFRIGFICFSPLIGYLAGGLFTYSFFQLEQTAGVIGMDHNDIAFCFYVTLSVWSYLEYTISGNKQFIYLIALFTALGTLTKWLPAMAIYGVWLCDILLINKKMRRGEVINFIKSIALSTLIWGSWQCYILVRWPIEALHEYEFNSRHFSEALEGHGGSWQYHFNMFDNHYGKFAIYLLVLGLIYFIRKVEFNKFKATFLIIPITTYLVFTMAKTQAFAYVFYVAPLIILIISVGAAFIINQITAFTKLTWLKNSIIASLFLLLCVLQLSAKALYASHVHGKSEYVNNYREVLRHNANIYKSLDSVARDCDIIFNCRSMQSVDAEFYSSKIVYDWYPDATTIDSLQAVGYKIGALQAFDRQYLPDYITNDTTIQIINLVQKSE